MLRYLFFILSVAAWISCSKKTQQIQPHIGRITESVYASGIVKSRNQYQVFATVSGLVQDIMVTEGDLVRKGDAIMRLVNEAAKLNMEQARLSAQNASIAANEDKLRELGLNKEVARAKMEHDEMLLSRQRTLWAQGIGTRNDLDALELASKTSSNAYNAAIVRYRDLERQIRFQSLQSQKTLQMSENSADDYLIRSTVDGKVYSLLRRKGEMVSPQSPVALIGDAHGFMLELQVDEYDIAEIRKGQKVLLQMDSYKGKVFDAEVEKIDPAMNTQSRSFTVEAAFISAPPVLYPNLTCEANIIIHEKEQALTIPRSYMIGDSLVLLKSRELRKVRTGLRDFQQAEILEGLHKDDVILKPDDGK
jgi:multidrug efflux pump subunit AcrA (membrane-fusion protein)